MRLLHTLLLCVCVGAAACGTGTEKPAAPAVLSAAPAIAHGNLLQVMRAIDFPHSNTIFDTQTKDPAAKPSASARNDGTATSMFSGLYGGWTAVENSAIALAESANLMLIPGRVCSNGKLAPVGNEDFRKYARGLADVGMAAYQAAQARNRDAMVELTGTVADACAACHEVYRDRGEAGSPERCVAVPSKVAAVQ